MADPRGYDAVAGVPGSPQPVAPDSTASPVVTTANNRRAEDCSPPCRVS